MTPQNAGVCAVTGASGYVGSIIVQALRPHIPVVEMVRNPSSASAIQWSLDSREGIQETLQAHNVRTLVHAAWDMRATTLRDMEQTCVQGSAALFEAARRAGVERIVFISTISAFDSCQSAYGKTKLSVEKLLQGASVVLRPGLVFGPRPGGVFGGIRNQVRNSRILPIIGSGHNPQYLLHEQTLGQSVRRAVSGEFDQTRGFPITLAHPKPWPFRDLVRSIAASENRQVTLVPVPWPVLFAGIRTGEALGLKLPFRSDSIVSFVHYNRNPDFAPQRSLGIEPIPYLPSC